MSTQAEAEREALVEWSALAEPDDQAALALVAAVGAAAAIAWVRRSAAGALVDPLPLAAEQVSAMVAAVERWRPRLADAQAGRLLDRAARVGARVVTRGEPEWPGAFDSLEAAAPFTLWIRGEVDIDAAWSRSIAVVGARASTAYGNHAAGMIAAEAAARAVTVISGGAYGIDAAAHRAALACGGSTVAVLAGGIDRMYPAGNAALLERVVEAGAVVSELPPGFAPFRSRFLSRNRLIAAARATVVVEAAARSGALNTAGHAQKMARPLGAVPGPITSGGSTGCHELIRGGGAVLVGRSEHALALATPIGEVDESGESADAVGRPDFENADERGAHAALSVRGSTTDAVARESGLTAGRAQQVLGTLAMRGLVELREGRWHRRRP